MYASYVYACVNVCAFVVVHVSSVIRMCICACICISICVCTCRRIQMYMCIYIYICRCILILNSYGYMYVCIHMYIYVYIYVCMYVCINVCMCLCLCTCLSLSLSLCLCVCACACVRARSTVDLLCPGLFACFCTVPVRWHDASLATLISDIDFAGISFRRRLLMALDCQAQAVHVPRCAGTAVKSKSEAWIASEPFKARRHWGREHRSLVRSRLLHELTSVNTVA